MAQQDSHDPFPARLSRRGFLAGAGGVALAAALAACSSSGGGGGSGGSKKADLSGAPDLATARTEGTLTLWHGDQEADVVTFLKGFTAKTGIKATELRVLPGQAIPKLKAELQSGASSVDVFNCGNLGILYQMTQMGMIGQYNSSEARAYDAEYTSSPAGYWTAYDVNDCPILYIPTKLSSSEAPKTYEDLLDPQFKNGKICFQDSTSGVSYTWWYMLKDKLPSDYFDKLGAQKPVAYASSTDEMTNLYNGNQLLGGAISSFQYTKSVRQKLAIASVYPDVGVPTNTESTSIISTTSKPHAARAFVDYLLSAEGSKAWNEIQGSRSPRSDVTITGLQNISGKTLLIPPPSDIKNFASSSAQSEFQTVWKKMVGS